MNASLLSERSCCVSRNTKLAKVFYYFDSNGTKQGPYNGAQLKALAENGSITPDTRVESEDGRHTKAKNIRGLFPQPVPPPVRPEQHSDTVSPDNPFITPQPESNTNTSSTENPSINPPSAPATPCPHCGEPVSASEKFCGSCGKSVSQSFGTFDNSFTPGMYDQPSSGGGFLNIGFTRFVTPIYISFIWIACIVVNAISLLVSPIWINIIAMAASEGGFGRADNPAFGALVGMSGFFVSVIVHSLSLLFDRIALEGIMVLFRIEKNTRAMRSKQQ